MFEQIIKYYTLKQLNEFSKAMRKIRKNAKTKQQRILAINKQIDLFNIMHKANNELAGVKTTSEFFMPRTIAQLSTLEVSKMWDQLKPRFHKSKKQAGLHFKSISSFLKFMGYNRPLANAVRRGARRNRGRGAAAPPPHGPPPPPGGGGAGPHLPPPPHPPVPPPGIPAGRRPRVPPLPRLHPPVPPLAPGMHGGYYFPANPNWVPVNQQGYIPYVAPVAPVPIVPPLPPVGQRRLPNPLQPSNSAPVISQKDNNVEAPTSIRSNSMTSVISDRNRLAPNEIRPDIDYDRDINVGTELQEIPENDEYIDLPNDNNNINLQNIENQQNQNIELDSDIGNEVLRGPYQGTSLVISDKREVGDNFDDEEDEPELQPEDDEDDQKMDNIDNDARDEETKGGPSLNDNDAPEGELIPQPERRERPLTPISIESDNDNNNFDNNLPPIIESRTSRSSSLNSDIAENFDPTSLLDLSSPSRSNSQTSNHSSSYKSPSYEPINQSSSSSATPPVRRRVIRSSSLDRLPNPHANRRFGYRHTIPPIPERMTINFISSLGNLPAPVRRSRAISRPRN